MNAMRKPAFHLTCYGWLGLPPHAGELKRWANNPAKAERLRFTPAF